jgi:hypothetical protein
LPGSSTPELAGFGTAPSAAEILLANCLICIQTPTLSAMSRFAARELLDEGSAARG